MLDLALSLMILTLIALLIGAVYLFRKGGAKNRQQALLMIALAMVIAVNVAIWTVPDEKGSSPVAEARQ